MHYDQGYENAFWDGAQMVFGDGDGEIFGDFTASVDVTGHELTHGVTQYTANLAYEGQSGALNESHLRRLRLPGQAVHLGQSADEADWLIGADLFTAGVSGVALRSMKAPGTAYDDPARQGPAARPHGRLRRDRPTTTAASTSTPASPTTPSTWPPRPSAATRGRRRADLVRHPHFRRVVRDSTFDDFAKATQASAQPSSAPTPRRSPL